MTIVYVISVPLVPADAMAALTLRAALDEMCAADPALAITVGPVNEIVLWGQSEPQLEIAVDILKRGKGLGFTVGAPQVQYCETITKRLVWDYTHKRQTGGKGEYAKVRIRFQPGEPGSGFVFENAVRGAAIPDAFVPAVEKAWRPQRRPASSPASPSSTSDASCSTAATTMSTRPRERSRLPPAPASAKRCRRPDRACSSR